MNSRDSYKNLINEKNTNNNRINNYERNTFLEPGSTMGEITGDNYNIDEVDQGMPLRTQYKKDRVDDTEIITYNAPHHLDFDLYDKKPQQQILYNDPYDSFSKPFEVDQILKTPNYKSNFIDNFNWKLINLLKNFIKTTILISPYSILNSLEILYLGSRDQTKQELTKYLFNKKNSFDHLIICNDQLLKTNSIKIMNMLFVNKNIKINKKFIKQLNNFGIISHFDKNLSSESYRINNLIKTYMNYNSNLNSNSDFDMIDKSMFNNSFIINCLTFNSIWKYKFDQNLTDLKTFMGSKQKLCLMMNMYNTQFYYTEDEKNQVIEIPYKDNNYVFGIILPKKQSTPECSEEQFNKYFNKLKLEPIEYLSIPKFNERKNYKLNNIFKKLNINSIFENCNLSHINDKITIDYVLHQINFSIDETGYKRPKIINNQKNIQFDANKTFLYYVRNLPLNKIMLTGIFS